MIETKIERQESQESRKEHAAAEKRGNRLVLFCHELWVVIDLDSTAFALAQQETNYRK